MIYGGSSRRIRLAQRRVVIRGKQRLQKLASDASDFDYWSILKRRKTITPTATLSLQ
jgi:hypothetical protein